jgi:NAD-dependent dihydropyrimidine dehydrogenase PreA subunit
MSYVITDACVDVLDRSCVEECPVDCIYPGARMAYIHPDECVDCGKCMPACPSDAIHWEYKGEVWKYGISSVGMSRARGQLPSCDRQMSRVCYTLQVAVFNNRYAALVWERDMYNEYRYRHNGHCPPGSRSCR